MRPMRREQDEGRASTAARFCAPAARRIFRLIAGRLYDLQVIEEQSIRAARRGQPRQPPAAGPDARAHPRPVRRALRATIRTTASSSSPSRPPTRRAGRIWRRRSTGWQPCSLSPRMRERDHQRSAAQSRVPADPRRRGSELGRVRAHQYSAARSAGRSARDRRAARLSVTAPTCRMCSAMSRRVSDADIEALRRARQGSESADLDPSSKRPCACRPSGSARTASKSALEEQLRGTPGARHVEVNAFGREIKELVTLDGTPGLDVDLTLDAELQILRDGARSRAKRGVVVMDISTGDILALASAPGFDPNPFAVGLTPEQWAALRDNELNPLINKPIAGQYPPGSTFKIVTALAGLASGAVTPDQTFYCGGSYSVRRSLLPLLEERRPRRDEHASGIKNSCDIYFYNVARAHRHRRDRQDGARAWPRHEL